ncbi:hypothetical protein BCR36DRAFT_586194 [Piromyces finnis]|uniref:FYVE-domain-containing protein n=1 Tax=Piromyces finnis TaxID=1754191 RepID=A0A1Y1V117_9FUNG|nr:hypothetical protein BCR36DRAFT_586194 [Piromyces finnis]|eukprot:ORX44338.1 hypothetical protein BCR36DRAFT_586194 [Piromyces finnis]
MSAYLARSKRTFGVKAQDNNNNSSENENLLNVNLSIDNEVEYNKRNVVLSPEASLLTMDSISLKNNYFECPICNEEIFGIFQLNNHLDIVHTENQSGNVILSIFRKTQKITEDITGAKTNIKNVQPIINKSHWEKSSIDDKCSYPECKKQLGIRNGKQNCYCCGKLFCDMHTNFSMRLSELAKPDSNSPNWFKVCQSCYTSREGYNNAEGQHKSLTHIFLEARKNNIEKLCLEENLLILRLEKLAKSLSVLHEKKGVSVNQRAIEQSVVQWKEDSSTYQCYRCNSRFGKVRNRRHHCRLCGQLFCNDCLEELPLYRDIKDETTLIGTTKSCNHCKRIVFRQKEMNTKEKLPQEAKLYEQIKFNQSIVDSMLPKYNELLLKLSLKSSGTFSKDSYQEAALYREKLIKNFHQIDLLSKRILKLPANSKYHRTLQTNIAKGSIIFLQNNMITLKMLPEKDEINVINEDIEKTKRIKEINVAMEALNDQYSMLQGYYQDALFNRKFDNAKILEESIQDITLEIEKLKVELEEINF